MHLIVFRIKADNLSKVVVFISRGLITIKIAIGSLIKLTIYSYKVLLNGAGTNIKTIEISLKITVNILPNLLEFKPTIQLFLI